MNFRMERASDEFNVNIWPWALDAETSIEFAHRSEDTLKTKRMIVLAKFRLMQIAVEEFPHFQMTMITVKPQNTEWGR